MVSKGTPGIQTKLATLPAPHRLAILIVVAFAVATVLIHFFGFDGGGITGWTGIGESLP